LEGSVNVHAIWQPTIREFLPVRAPKQLFVVSVARPPWRGLSPRPRNHDFPVTISVGHSIDVTPACGRKQGRSLDVARHENGR
jgi:hypothetical protein